MKRFTAVRKLLDMLKENDVVIFNGLELCKEAYEYDKPGYFYINNNVSLALPFALGIALSTDKRVFVFTGEGDLLRDLSSIAQMAVSKCKNIFLIILDNGVYQSVGNLPHIFEGLSSKKGFVYNLGCFTHDFTSRIKGNYSKEIRGAIDRIRGPMTIFIEVEKDIKKDLKDIDISFEDQTKRLMEFIQNRDTNTALYEPPNFINIPEGNEINSIDFSKVLGGIS